MKLIIIALLVSSSVFAASYSGTMNMNYSLGQQSFSMVPLGQLQISGLMGNQQVNVTVNDQGQVSVPPSSFMQYFNMIRMPSYGAGGARYTPMFINPSFYQVRVNSTILNLGTTLLDGCNSYSVSGYMNMTFSLNGASVQVQKQTPGMGTSITTMNVIGGSRIGNVSSRTLRVCKN